MSSQRATATNNDGPDQNIISYKALAEERTLLLIEMLFDMHKINVLRDENNPEGESIDWPKIMTYGR